MVGEPVKTYYKLLSKPTQLTRLAKNVEDEDYDKVVRFINMKLPTCPTLHVSTDVVLEVGDILSQVIYEDIDLDDYSPIDFIDYLELTIPYLKAQQKQYHKELAELKRRVSLYSYQRKLGQIVTYPTKHEREVAGYTLEVINATLEELDLFYKYNQYNEGYYYYKYKIFKWLITELEDTLTQLKEDLK